MRRFADLYVALDASQGTNAKIAVLVAYFRAAPPDDAAWAAYFLTGRKLKRLVGSRDLRAAALAASGLPEWLFEASYEAVGDLAETISLTVPPPMAADDRSLTQWVEQELAPLAGLAPPVISGRLAAAWQLLPHDARFVFIKLLTGSFRVGAARQLVYRALAETAGVPVTEVAQRLIGEWAPSTGFIDRLRGEGAHVGNATHRPYPFFLAYPLLGDPATLGKIDEWQAEWKWDGIRAQLVIRANGASLWSRGEELVSAAFPELLEAARELPQDTVLDGEILAWPQHAPLPLPFGSLQRRLNRKSPSLKLQQDVPVALIAYDLLEADSLDIRARPLRERRARLETLIPSTPTVRLSPLLLFADWQELASVRAMSRERRAEGVMLKRRDSAYGVGRTRGAWWKWKVDPYTIDAVLVYAQAGHGRRASLYTDYTFAVWDDGNLVPFAKAYSGLDDSEMRAVDTWVRSHTLERFGPVRQVEPQLVFELGFEGLQASPRHKSGVAVRFPRMLRWRRDKPAAEADSLATLKSLAATGDAL